MLWSSIYLFVPSLSDLSSKPGTEQLVIVGKGCRNYSNYLMGNYVMFSKDNYQLLETFQQWRNSYNTKDVIQVSSPHLLSHRHLTEVNSNHETGQRDAGLCMNMRLELTDNVFVYWKLRSASLTVTDVMDITDHEDDGWDRMLGEGSTNYYVQHHN